MMTVAMQSSAALYVLNHKRGALAEIEKKFDVKIDISVDDSLIPPNFTIQRIKTDNDDREISDGGASDGDRENCDDEPKRRKRRRPRRRKRSDQETVAEGLDRPITSNEDNDDTSSLARTAGDEETDTDEENRAVAADVGVDVGAARRTNTSWIQRMTVFPLNCHLVWFPAAGALSSERVAKVENEAELPIAIPTAADGDSRHEEKPKPKRRRRVRRKASPEPAANDATSEILGTDGQPNVPDTAPKPAGSAVLRDSGRADGETTDTKPDARDMPPLPAADSDSPPNTVTIVDAETSGANIESNRKGWWQKLVE